MNRWLARVVIVGVLVLLVGCAPAGEYGSWVPPSTGVQADCERSGGVWRAALNFCEHPRAAAPDGDVRQSRPLDYLQPPEIQFQLRPMLWQSLTLVSPGYDVMCDSRLAHPETNPTTTKAKARVLMDSS
jgi:hypothetical protein